MTTKDIKVDTTIIMQEGIASYFKMLLYFY